MTIRKMALVDIGSITNISEVLSSLRQLDSQLADLKLEQFILFNQSYQVVTRLIQQSVNDGYFKNPEVIEEFIVSFADYYFCAINSANSGEELSAPWAKLNDYANIKSAPIFISLMLCASAHINNDLPQVLKKIVRQCRLSLKEA